MNMPGSDNKLNKANQERKRYISRRRAGTESAAGAPDREARSRVILGESFAIPRAPPQEAVGLTARRRYGSDEAMMAIARLFLHTSFRQENRNDWAKLALTGAPVLPWDMHSATGQNLEGALYWAKKAAEAGNAEGCCLAGNMLCRGIGCQPNPEAGILFLKAARSKGVERAQDLLYIYQPGKISLADSDYTETLAQLDTALKTENPDRQNVLRAEKGHGERQMAKLGYGC